MKTLKILSLAIVLLLVLAAAFFYEGDMPKDVVDARYTSPASQFLDLGDAGRIHYRDEGNRNGPAVILLHGSNSSLHAFEPWVERLGNQYRAISIDLPGHGLTGETPSGIYNNASYVDVVRAIADNLGIEEFVLAGNSMGGAVAWQFALAYPERLPGLVLIDAPGPPQWYRDVEPGSSVMIFNLLRQDWFRFISTKLDPYYLTKQGVQAAYNNSPVVNDALIRRYYELNLRAGTRRATMTRFSQFSIEPVDVSIITTPTLIMWGREDSLIGMDQADRLAKTLPNTQTAYYDQVGHMPMEEIPDKSAADLMAFIESL